MCPLTQFADEIPNSVERAIPERRVSQMKKANLFICKFLS
jgi:hypothetical protein